MKIALVGATGFIGSKILDEALRRGHKVTAIARDVSGLLGRDNVEVEAVDVNETDNLSEVLAGHDLVIAAYNAPLGTGQAGHKSILEATRGAGVARILFVGNTGSLNLEDGRRYVETEHFPDAWRAGSLELAGVLDWLQVEVSDIDWVFLSPADAIMPGERTGKFRLGGDTIVRDGSGKSAISVEDYAVAMLDEAEKPAHHRQRFTLAY